MWDKGQALLLGTAVRLAMGPGHTDNLEDAEHLLPAIGTAYKAMDLPALWRATSDWFRAAELDIRWYVGPVLTAEQLEWIGGRDALRKSREQKKQVKIQEQYEEQCQQWEQGSLFGE